MLLNRILNNGLDLKCTIATNINYSRNIGCMNVIKNRTGTTVVLKDNLTVSYTHTHIHTHTHTHTHTHIYIYYIYTYTIYSCHTNQQLHCLAIIQIVDNLYGHKNLHMNVYSRFIHNCQSLESTKMS